MTATGITARCSVFSAHAKAKFLLLGPAEFPLEDPTHQARSLNFEHVSPHRLKGPEISRRAASAAADEVNRLALMRRWFFTRKPDAGFVLTDFPATLLQALVFDEWLATRDEALDGVYAESGAAPSVVEHYRTLGLLRDPSDLARA